MSKAEERHEQLLQDVLTGERSERDPEVQRALAEAPELRARLRRLQGLAGRLERVGRDDRRLLEEAMGGASPLEGAVATMLRRARRRRPLWPVLAAAAMLLLALVIVLRSGSERPHDVFLGLGPGEMRPAGVVTEYAAFEWNFPLPEGDSFEIRFFAGDDIPLRHVLLAVNVGDARVFRPTAEQRQRLPDDLQWQVLVVEPGGGSRGAGLRSVRLAR